MERIGIFGGTFNPPHLGHQNIAEGFIDHCALDSMLIIPSFVPPHKAAPDLASGKDRLAMCQRTFTDRRFTIDRIELDRRGKSYTVDTLRELKQRYGKDSRLFFLMGDDMLLYLEHWKDPRIILQLAQVVAAVRHADLSLDMLRDYAKQKFPAEYEAGRFIFYQIPPVEVSSTEIREKCRRGESISGLVTPEVQQYILDRGLYHDTANRSVHG